MLSLNTSHNCWVAMPQESGLNISRVTSMIFLCCLKIDLQDLSSKRGIVNLMLLCLWMRTCIFLTTYVWGSQTVESTIKPTELLDSEIRLMNDNRNYVSPREVVNSKSIRSDISLVSIELSRVAASYNMFFRVICSTHIW